MAKQTPILNKSFTADAAVPRANLCLVMSGVNAGNVAAPGAADATKFVGVSQEPSPSALDSSKPHTVALMVAGLAQIESDGSAPITAGDYVAIGNVTGQIKTVTPAFGGATLKGVVGIALNTVAATAGLLVDVLLQPMLHKP